MRVHSLLLVPAAWPGWVLAGVCPPAGFVVPALARQLLGVLVPVGWVLVGSAQLDWVVSGSTLAVLVLVGLGVAAGAVLPVMPAVSQV